MAKIGTAGNAGDRIRSDCLIRVEPVSSGGITINLDSKVDKLYGRYIRELAMSVLEHFGVTNARVEIMDSSALEFVLAARLEAALKQWWRPHRNHYGTEIILYPPTLGTSPSTGCRSYDHELKMKFVY